MLCERTWFGTVSSESSNLWMNVCKVSLNFIRLNELFWRGGYVSSYISTNSAGVMLLYSSKYECKIVVKIADMQLLVKCYDNKMV